MARIIGFLAVALGLGAVLALVSVNAAITTGWIGAVALIGWALLARSRWERQRATTGAEPGGPERVIWHRFAGTGILLGHLFAALSTGLDLHVGSGNSLAIDSWTILGSMMVSALVFNGDARERDERDRAIAARGLRAGYAALIVQLILLLLYLGFTPPNLRVVLTHWVLTNLLIGLIVSSILIMYLVQLSGYAADGSVSPQEPLRE
jgi:hypothetical protein